MKAILLGNAGAGKSTMARSLIASADGDVSRLSLDEIAWGQIAQRLPLSESLQRLRRFLTANDEWIIEGCYGDLVEAALPYCTELRFLNPGVDVCVAHCRKRPWEPEKFPSAEAQQNTLGQLLEWVEEYKTREDEYGLKRHRKIFEGFAGAKREFTSVASYFED
jgi:adenylate kinase family enzyme